MQRGPHEELLSHEDRMAQLREQGIDRPEEVRLAIMEADGRISVLPYEPERRARPPERRAP